METVRPPFIACPSMCNADADHSALVGDHQYRLVGEDSFRSTSNSDECFQRDGYTAAVGAL